MILPMGKLYLSKLGTSYGTSSPQGTKLGPSPVKNRASMALPDPEKRGAPQLQVGFFPSSHSYNICCNHPKTCSSPRYFHKLRGSLSCGTTCETPQLFLDASTRCFETIASVRPRGCGSALHLRHLCSSAT